MRTSLLRDRTCDAVGSNTIVSVTSGDIVGVPLPKRGWLRKQTVHNDPSTPDQIKFVEWAWEMGEKIKKKFSARRTASLMVLHGTRQGQKLFPSDKYWETSPSGWC